MTTMTTIEAAAGTTTISGVRTVAVDVADQEAALDFYVRTLGFETRLDAQASPTMRWIEVAAPTSAVTISLIAGDRPAGIVDTGIRFAVPNAEDEHTAMASRGVEVGELLRWDGAPPMFSFDDPDGNRFVIVEDHR